jgi:hypothetical protein
MTKKRVRYFIRDKYMLNKNNCLLAIGTVAVVVLVVFVIVFLLNTIPTGTPIADLLKTDYYRRLARRKLTY